MTDEAKKVTVLKPLQASTALANKNTWESEIARWRQMIYSGALPKSVDTPQKAIAIVRMGEAYGWDPMRALRSIHIVEGRPELSAEAMLALIREKCPEAQVYPLAMTAEMVTIRVCRPPQVPDPIDYTVTIDQFKHLVKPTRKGSPSVWMLYPSDMLWARCVSRIGRRFFPDVIAGAYTLGELEEMGMTVHQIGPQDSIPLDDPDTDADVLDAEPEDEIDEIDAVYSEADTSGALPGDEDAP